MIYPCTKTHCYTRLDNSSFASRIWLSNLLVSLFNTNSNIASCNDINTLFNTLIVFVHLYNFVQHFYHIQFLLLKLLYFWWFVNHLMVNLNLYYIILIFYYFMYHFFYLISNILQIFHIYFYYLYKDVSIVLLLLIMYFHLENKMLCTTSVTNAK